MHEDIEGYDWNLDQPDHEGEMATGQLHRIADMALELLDIINDNDELPAWVQFKLDRSYNDMTDLFSYIESNSHEHIHFDKNGMMMDDIDAEPLDEAKKRKKKNTLWGNIRDRRKAKKPRLKPGQKGYPKTLNIDKKSK